MHSRSSQAATRSAGAASAAAAKSSGSPDLSSSSSAAAASAGEQGDNDQKTPLSESSSPAPEGEEDAPAEEEALDGVTFADMLKAMQAMRDEMKELRKQQQPQPLSLSASAPSPAPPADASAPQAAATSSGPAPHAQAAATADIASLLLAMQEGQARQASQLLLLQSLGELPSFTGKGADTTLVAEEWLQRTEDFFVAREQAMGIDAAKGEQARLRSVATVLQDDARRWYAALPKRPATWLEFQEAVKARFCSVPSERIRVDRLTEFVEKASRLRDRLNVQGMQAFTARFAQLAGEVPDDLVTGRGKLALLSRGLPQRYAEVVLKEEAKKPTPPLHEVINTVLARASQKEQAASYGGASSSPASAAPMNLDAISLAVATFGWTREEANQHLSDSEGWAPHDTHGGPQGSSFGQGTGPASKGSSTPAPSAEDKLDKILNALTAKVGAGPSGREHGRSRRNAPSGVLKDIPQALFEERKKLGLCCKCGVAKYEPGGHGHNAVTCKAPADKTTTAAEGRKKAGF